MYPLAAPAVYVNDTVMANDMHRQRVERVVAALKEPVELAVYSDEELLELIKNEETRAPSDSKRPGERGNAAGREPGQEPTQ